jgi:hypothetical protein
MAAPPADAAAKQANPAHPVAATAPRDAGEPITAIVSIKSQQVTIYDADGWILRAPVSTGIKGRETPAGVFSVVEKDKDHHSNLYDDAWMPNMERITWSGIALHGGPLPGYAASHGCIRMPYDFAENLFGKTQIGMRVIIAPNDAEPVEISDPKLFVPNADALAAAPARAEALARESADAAKATDEAKAAATLAAREAAAAPAAVRKMEALKSRADAELAFAEKLLAAAKTDEDKARAEDARQKVAAKAADFGTQLDTAMADAKAKLDAAAAAKDAVKTAEAKRADTAGGARRQTRAGAGLGLYQPQDQEALCPARLCRHHRGPDHDPRSRQADRHPYLHRGGAHRYRPALDRGHHRRWRRRQGRARSHRHPAGRAGPHRTDRSAAILAHHLGRAAEPRAELSHRIHRRAEQPAPGRAGEPPARERYGRARQRLGRLRLRLCAPVRRPVRRYVLLLSPVVKTQCVARDQPSARSYSSHSPSSVGGNS